MKNIESIAFHTGTREELLPDFPDDFPYLASRARLDRYAGQFVPWHWHRPVELFYMESGLLEYRTPGGRILFPAGSGGMVNSNVLHTTRTMTMTEPNIQLLHIFDVSLLADPASRIGQSYITPLIAAPQLEILPLFPADPDQKKILHLLLQAFSLSDQDFGYELKLRNALSQIWLLLFEQARPLLARNAKSGGGNEKLKQMMIFIHEHFPEKISISQLAAAACLSERECFRVFQECLHMTPMEYLKSCRLQAACRMLEQGQTSLTETGQACGLGSGSYFGKIFREYAGCTPSEYRKKWQDFDSFRQE